MYATVPASLAFHMLLEVETDSECVPVRKDVRGLPIDFDKG